MSNDEDTKALLTEIRDILQRVEARDGEWIHENRQLHRDAFEKNMRFGRQNAIVIWILLAAIVALFAVFVFAELRKVGIV